MIADDISFDALDAEVRAYREARVRRLTASTGWLSIINKAWLGAGKHSIGAAPGSDILLPDDRSPPQLGTITRNGAQIRFDAAPSVNASARGELITSLVLRSDAEPQPDQIAVGSLRFELIQRGDDFAVRVRDTDSVAARIFPGIPAFAINARARVVGRVEPSSPPREVTIPDNDGRNQIFASAGTAAFVFDGVACRLELFWEGDGRRLFLLFGDATNRDETYAAGRFLYAAPPADGHVVLDFNKAFNPPCAFTPYASCPLPSAENRLSVRIAAGEKRPAVTFR